MSKKKIKKEMYEELLEYIRKENGKGFSFEEIKAALISAGHDGDLVDNHIVNTKNEIDDRIEEQILNYIVKQEKNGYTHEVIKEALINSGINMEKAEKEIKKREKELVNKAFRVTLTVCVICFIVALLLVSAFFFFDLGAPKDYREKKALDKKLEGMSVDEKKATLEDILLNNDMNYVAHVELAKIYQKENGILDNRAFEHLQKAKNLSSNYYHLHEIIGEIDFKTTKFQEAKVNFEMAIEHGYNINKETYSMLGLSNIRLGSNEEAKYYLEKGLKNDYNSNCWRYDLAALYLSEEDVKNTMRHLNIILSSNNDDDSCFQSAKELMIIVDR